MKNLIDSEQDASSENDSETNKEVLLVVFSGKPSQNG